MSQQRQINILTKRAAPTATKHRFKAIDDRLETKCRVYNKANLPIPNDSNTYLTFNGEIFVGKRMHSLVFATSRITVIAAGHYEVGYNVLWAAGENLRVVELLVDRKTLIHRVDNYTTTVISQTGTTLTDKLNIGQYLECRVYQDSGDTLDILHYGNVSPIFWAQRMD